MSRREPTAWDNFWWNVGDWFHDHGIEIAVVLAIVLAFVISEASAFPLSELYIELEYVPEEVCFENGNELVKPEFVVSNLLVTANWFNTAEELKAAVSELGYEVDESLELSLCEVHPEQNIGWCEVWLVIPKTVIGDPFMDSLGHEVAHGFFGDFHE